MKWLGKGDHFAGSHPGPRQATFVKPFNFEKNQFHPMLKELRQFFLSLGEGMSATTNP